MRKSNKKGFTVVELVIVIAIIAILAGVLIPTFASLIQKANESKDTQLVKNLNTALAADNKEHKTMTDALDAAAEFGYDVGKINASATGNEILWDSENDVFCYLKNGNVEYIPETNLKSGSKPADYKLWKIYDGKNGNTVPAYDSQTYSIYWAGEDAPSVTEVKVGFDAGTCTKALALTYKNTDSAKDVVIRTNGGTLTVGAAGEVAKGQIYHYGVVDKAVVYTETSCFHTLGAVGKMELKAGKVIAEKGSIIYLTEAKETGVEVEENGGKFVIPAGVTTTDVLPTVVESIGYTEATIDGGKYDNSLRSDSAYEIGTLAELEQFRDLVNGGFAFAGCKVVLTADIKLNDGWTPIGEGARQVAKTGYAGNYAGENADARLFKGEFDGQGHTISNLNNKRFVPKFTYQEDNNPNSIFTYGFFGILFETANVHDVKFANVNIDTAEAIKNVRGEDSVGDSVAALVGFVDGDVTISNIEVLSGTIKGTDAVGGIIGRWYNLTASTTLSGLKNKATIIGMTSKGAKAAGLVGFVSNVKNNSIYTFENCHNDADITVGQNNNQEAYADLMCCYNNINSNLDKVSFDDNCSATGTVKINSGKGYKNFSSWAHKKGTKIIINGEER